MHEFWEEQLPFYVAGTLPYEQARWLEKHMQNCPHCRRTLGEWRWIENGIKSVGKRWSHGLPPLSPAVRHVTAMPQNVIPLPPRVLPSPRLKPQQRKKGRWFHLAVAAVLVFACLLMVTGVLLYSLTPINTPTPVGQIAFLPSATPTRELLVLVTNTPRPLITPTVEPAIAIVPPPVGRSEMRITEPRADMRSSAGSDVMGIVEAACFAMPLIDPIPVRERPEVDSVIIELLDVDERLSVSSNNGLGWYEVFDVERRLTGWLLADSVRLSGECEMFRRPISTPVAG